MDGLILVDKPAGPTSHDVVERMRRVLGEPRIGHTGTLDPTATGLLPLVLGRATRLARFLSASDKAYAAAIRLGVATSTGDAEGDPVGTPHVGPPPARDAIDRALDAFRGTHPQQPPAFSAKRIAGERSYKLARRARANPDRGTLVQAAAVDVTAHAIDVVSYESDTFTLTLFVECSAGFYVRSLAHDLGQHLGTGAHLTALRRIRAGTFSVDEAIPLADAERQPERAAAALVPMAGILANWSSAVLSAAGVRRALNGRDLGPADIQRMSAGNTGGRSPRGHVLLVDDAGELIGIGEPTDAPGLLHPSVVLR